jgi:hypothetical protein
MTLLSVGDGATVVRKGIVGSEGVLSPLAAKSCSTTAAGWLAPDGNDSGNHTSVMRYCPGPQLGSNSGQKQLTARICVASKVRNIAGSIPYARPAVLSITACIGNPVELGVLLEDTDCESVPEADAD